MTTTTDITFEAEVCSRMIGLRGGFSTVATYQLTSVIAGVFQRTEVRASDGAPLTTDVGNVVAVEATDTHLKLYVKVDQHNDLRGRETIVSTPSCVALYTFPVDALADELVASVRAMGGES